MDDVEVESEHEEEREESREDHIEVGPAHHHGQYYHSHDNCIQIIMITLIILIMITCKI